MNDWTELRSKSIFVDRQRRQYLTRHAFDLWYLDMLKTVSRRAVRVLLVVRRWQRRDWVQWVARFRYRTLAGRFLRYWRDCPLGLIASSSDDYSTHMFMRVHVRSSSELAAVRLRRHRFVRRSRREQRLISQIRLISRTGKHKPMGMSVASAKQSNSQLL